MSQNATIQSEIKNLKLGTWASFPYDLFLFIKKKILTHYEFTIFQYMFLTLMRKNKFTGNFSTRHLVRETAMSRRTVMNCLRVLESLELVSRHFEHDNYGEVYTLNLGKIELILSELSHGIANTPPEAQAIPPEAQAIPQEAQAIPNIIFYYINLYLSYIKELSDDQKDSFAIDCHRLIGEGFSVDHIRTFLELRIKKRGFGGLNEVGSFYALIKKFGKENLILIENKMTAERLRREKLREANEQRINNLKMQSSVYQPQQIKLVDRGGVASFKIDL